MNDDLNRLLGSADADMSALARRTIDTAVELVPGAQVTIDRENIGVGRGPGYKHLVFVITPRREYVTLGVHRGADLPDPAGLLEGKGKVHRHVKLRSDEDLDRPALRELMAAAAARGPG